MVRPMVKTMIVDGCHFSLEQLKEWCRLTGKAAVVGAHIASRRALEQLRREDVELVLVDMDGPGMAGLEQELRQVKPQVVVMCLSREESRCIQAMRARADDFLFKPYGKAEIEQLIDKALLLRARLNAQILRVKTFGCFEVWVGQERVHLSNAKSRELLALCVDHRGEAVSMEEAIDKLWPGEPLDERVKKRYRRAILDIRKALSHYGAAQALQTQRKVCRVAPEMLQCDYFDFLNGKSGPFLGKPWEYMKEYSWGEVTAGKMYTLCAPKGRIAPARGGSRAYDR